MAALRAVSAAAFARRYGLEEEIARLEEGLPADAVRECRLEAAWEADPAKRRLPPSLLELEEYARELSSMAGSVRAAARMAAYRSGGIRAFRASGAP